MSAKEYEKELRKLQEQLCQLQEWVKHKGLRVMIIFEGRDAAGKGVDHAALDPGPHEGQGRHHPGSHREGQPADFPGRRAACAFRSREVANVYAALHGAFPGGG